MLAQNFLNGFIENTRTIETVFKAFATIKGLRKKVACGKFTCDMSISYYGFAN